MMNLLIAMTTGLLAAVAGAGSVEASPQAEHDLAGRWTWKWTDAEGNVHRHVMVVEGQPDKYAAKERRDDLEPVEVESLAIQRGEVSFSVPRGDTRATYTGRFADPNTINGEVRIQGPNNRVEEFGWTAERVLGEPEDPTEASPGGAG